MMKTKIIYMQNKKARKKLPPVGTKRYPIIYLGLGELFGQALKILCNWHNDATVMIDPEEFRFYALSKTNGEWLKNISIVEFGRYWLP